MPKKKIVCIDESPELIEIIRRVLEHGGIDAEFFAAMEGQEGLKIASKEKVDLIILDMHLPGGETWGLIEQIRADKHLKDTRIVGLSRGIFNNEIEESILSDSQPDTYLRKPLDIDKMLDKVKQYLQ